MLKRGVIILGVILLLVVILLFAFPVIFKNQISYRVKTELNDRISAKVDYNDLSISIFRSFPNLSVTLKDITVIGQNDFKNDTLNSIKELGFTINLWCIISGKGYRITALKLVQPVLKLCVNNAGRANWDIIKSMPDVVGVPVKVEVISDSAFLFQVNNWSVEHGYIEYKNDTAKTLFIANDLNFNGSQIVDKSKAHIDINAAVKQLSFKAGSIAFLQNAKIEAGAHLSSENNTGSYLFSEGHISINQLQLILQGTVSSTTVGQNFKLSVESRETAFKSLLSVFPAINDNSLAQAKSSGKFSLSGNISGSNNAQQSPAFAFRLNINNGMLQQPGSAKPLQHIYAAAGITKPQGPIDSMALDVSRFHIETGNDSINARIRVITPATNAFIAAEVKGGIDLTSMQQFFSSKDVKQLTGSLYADIKLTGHKNDLDSKNYNAIRSSGMLKVRQLVFQKKDWPFALKIEDADFSVSPDYVTLSSLNGGFGTCRFKGTGKSENVLPYLAGQGVLKAGLNLTADSMNLSVFGGNLLKQSSMDPAVSTSNKTAAPANTQSSTMNQMDLSIHIAINRLYNDKLAFSNTSGWMEYSGNVLKLKDVSAGIMGGKVILNTTCNNCGQTKPAITFNVKASNIDIAQVYKNIDDADKTAPAVKYLSGDFSGYISGSGQIKMGNCLKLEAFIADGNLYYPDLKMNEMPVLMEIAKLAKVKSLEHLEAKNVQSTFHFKNGNAIIDPTDIRFTSGYKLNFRGTSFANHTLDADIALDVPVKEFGSIASMAQNLLSGFMNVPQNVHFAFKVTGNSTQPVVKVINVGTSEN